MNHHQHQHQHQQLHQQEQHQEMRQNMQQTSSGLTRYRSAPSSYFDTLLNSTSRAGDGFDIDGFDHLFNQQFFGSETHQNLPRFTNNVDFIGQNSSSNTNVQANPEFQFVSQVKDETEVQQPQRQLQRQQSNDYSSVMMYQNQSQESRNMDHVNSAADDSYRRLVNSINSDGMSKMKMEGLGGGNSNLIRHSSSPAGLFADINIEELGAMRGMRKNGADTNAIANATFSSATRFNSQMDFPSRHPSSSRVMTPISEIGSTSIEDTSPGKSGDFIPGFPVTSWEDSAILSDDYLKGLGDNVNTADDQPVEGGNRPTCMLSHHLSLPSNATDLSSMLQDSVPCKIRAKRGFATHPRSVAERVRRTKISERIRKLQDLVPNMDKQTNTADMLDLAVDYIKDLQRQVKTLSDNRAKCVCSAKQNL